MKRHFGGVFLCLFAQSVSLCKKSVSPCAKKAVILQRILNTCILNRVLNPNNNLKIYTFMKKFFLFIGAVMMAVAMQATVVTQNFDLSGTSAYGTATVSGGSITDAAEWSGAELWQWTVGALAYDHVVLEVADHANPILFRIQWSDETNVEKQIPAGVNTMAIEITQDIVKGVFVLNWSDVADVDITITGLYLRGGIGEKKEVALLNDSKVFDEWNTWEDRIVLGAALFEDLHAGDVLEINYTPDEHGYHQLKMHLDWDGETALAFLANVIDEYKQININTTENPTQMRFPIISETDVANIKAQGGLAIHGKYITVNSIKLIRHDVLWSGEQVVENWSGHLSVAASKLSDLQVGNILCFRISAIGSTDAPRVSLYCGWNPEDALADGEYYFQGTDEAPMVVERPVTVAMLAQLQGKDLLVRGVNYTMTDIFVKEGTPVTTVSANLTVSAAGMATYILPFNVPSLPEGVQAYDLTNDGSNVITATEVNALTADKPVLIVAAAGEYEFISEEGASDDISGKTDTYANGALVGTYQAIAAVPQTEGGNYNYVLQQHGDEVAFYQVKSDDCALSAYRAYLSCGHNHAASGPSAAPMRIVFHKDATTGIEDVQTDKVQSTKVLRNGQLFILRNGVEYNVNGQMVK